MYRSGPTVPADIVTYRHNQKLVYVKPADNYEQALDIAQKEFPEDLASVPRQSIGFAVTSMFNGERQLVRISESAWVGTVARLLRGEIIDVYVRRDPESKSEAPPQYLEVPQPRGPESTRIQGTGGTRHARSNPALGRSNSPSNAKDSEKSRRSWFGSSPK